MRSASRGPLALGRATREEHERGESAERGEDGHHYAGANHHRSLTSHHRADGSWAYRCAMEPPQIDAILLERIPRLDVPRHEDGTIQFPTPVVYPLPGFVRAGDFDFGNGDAAGYYWPIGLEESEPVWCEIWHDGWSMEPVATSLTQYLIDERAADDATFSDEADEVEAELGTPLMHDSRRKSPKLLLESARVANTEGRVDEAEADLRAAIALLPEFGQAHVQLANVLRRQRNTAEALRHDLVAMGCPSCLTADREAATRRVAAARDDALVGDDDPLFQRRRDLTFATGVKFNDDFVIYEEVIAAYFEQGDPARGVRLRVLVGELMSAETTSFWERYDWSPEVQTERLRHELDRFLPARNAVVTDTAGLW